MLNYSKNFKDMIFTELYVGFMSVLGWEFSCHCEGEKPEAIQLFTVGSELIFANSTWTETDFVWT